MNDFVRRTWTEINVNAVEHNYNKIRERLKPETLMMCVVKADAYGHGVEIVAKELDSLGADCFAVSNIEEAKEIRSLGITKPLLILGFTPPELAGELYENNITQSVFSLDYAKALNNNAAEGGFKVKSHLKIDTGMGRIGILYHDKKRDEKSIDIAEEICRLSNLDFEGVFTHFAVADEGEEGREFTLHQYDCFMSIIEALEKRGINFKIRHCCNSAATIAYPEFHLDMVRPGIILYGLNPSDELKGEIDLEPVMQLKSLISLVKETYGGTTVSYGRTYTVPENSIVATVPIGYADGYPRSLSNRQDMLVCGKRVPIIGRVCMDQLMLDVTGVDGVHDGQTVVVFGKDGGESISVDEIASKNGTINYETVCLIGKRVPRLMVKDGKTIGTVNYFSRSNH